MITSKQIYLKINKYCTFFYIILAKETLKMDYKKAIEEKEDILDNIRFNNIFRMSK